MFVNQFCHDMCTRMKRLSLKFNFSLFRYDILKIQTNSDSLNNVRFIVSESLILYNENILSGKLQNLDIRPLYGLFVFFNALFRIQIFH